MPLRLPPGFGCSRGMNIIRGWSVKYGDQKFSVMVEEVDLLRMLAERGAEDPGAVAAGITTQDVYLIMDAEAQAFTFHSLAKQEPAHAKDHYARCNEFLADRNRLLDKYVPAEPAG